MIIYDLEGHKHPWKLTGHIATSNKYSGRPRSKLHLSARSLIIETFPTVKILEEVPIKIGVGITLYLDFYLPLTHTAIEVHGEQHYKYNSFYHKRQWDFIIQRKNDSMKSEWCETNNIDLIVLPYNEDINEWKQRLSCTENE